MSRTIKITVVLITIIWVVFLGFFRDYLFVNVNYTLSYLYGERMYNYADSALEFLVDYKASTLYTLKWVLTVVFFGLYWLTGFAFIKLLYKKNSYIWIYTIIYLALFVFAGLAYVGGDVFSDPGEGYTLARQIMGWGQSPIPLMFLWGGLHLDQQR